MAVSKAQQRAVTKYDAKTYDKTLLRLQKGRLDVVKAHATARGESVNGFINRAIGEAMERDNAGGPTGTDGILPSKPEAAQAAGEGLPQFVARAVETQAQRDALAWEMGINPAAGGKLEEEA